MHRTRIITGFLLGISLIGVAATYYPGGMQRFYGTDNLTNLVTGAVYFQTASNTFWVGGVTSNPVKVGDAAWSNNVTASVTNGLLPAAATNGFVYGSVTNGLATTNYVHAQSFVTASVTNGLATTNYVMAAARNVQWNIISSANLVITNEYLIFTSGICTVTLPSVTSTGRVVGIIKRDNTNTLTIVGQVENDTNGASFISRWSSDFIADGTNWWIK